MNHIYIFIYILYCMTFNIEFEIKYIVYNFELLLPIDCKIREKNVT